MRKRRCLPEKVLSCQKTCPLLKRRREHLNLSGAKSGTRYQPRKVGKGNRNILMAWKSVSKYVQSKIYSSRRRSKTWKSKFVSVDTNEEVTGHVHHVYQQDC